MRNMKIRKAVQKGFTLLELLVVITILAVLATGALLAYEGLTDSASAGAAANNAATADQAIRNYKAVTGNYPNQWDHLVTDVAGDGTTPIGTEAGQPLAVVSDATYRFLASVNVTDVSTQLAITQAFLNVGVDEFQVRTTSAAVANLEPNLIHNEGAVRVVEGAASNTTVELEPEDKFFDRLVVVPTTNDTQTTLCKIGGGTPGVIRTGINSNVENIPLASNFINKVNDFFEPGDCHLIAAFGFGNDAAKSTTGTSVAIASAPTYSSGIVNPARNYARYIALFHLGTDSNGDEDVVGTEIFQKPKLLGVLDAEGKLVDQNIAAVSTTNQ